MKYYGADDSVNSKVRSYVFTIERVQGQLMGVAECHVQGDLTAEELDRLNGMAAFSHRAASWNRLLPSNRDTLPGIRSAS